jgi:flavodoxin
MKKSSAALSLLCLCAFLSGAAFARAEAKDERVLVVYYSRTGHTQKVADELAKKFHADVEPLVDEHKRTGLFGASSAAKDAVARNKTTLGPLKHDLKNYDMILIGGPSWFGNTTPAVRTFITQNDLTGKKIGLFGLCHVSGVEHALLEAAELLSQEDANKIPTMPLRERELKVEVLTKKIDAFYEAMNMSQKEEKK